MFRMFLKHLLASKRSCRYEKSSEYFGKQLYECRTLSSPRRCTLVSLRLRKVGLCK